VAGRVVDDGRQVVVLLCVLIGSSFGDAAGRAGRRGSAPPDRTGRRRAVVVFVHSGDRKGGRSSRSCPQPALGWSGAREVACGVARIPFLIAPLTTQTQATILWFGLNHRGYAKSGRATRTRSCDAATGNAARNGRLIPASGSVDERVVRPQTARLGTTRVPRHAY
jgi:hypothetical protein